MQKDESEKIEYKESLSEKFDAGYDIAALANKSGGSLFFGIKNNGEVKGIQEISEKTIRELSNLYSDNIEPKLILDIEHILIQNKNVIEIKVIKSSTPYHAFKGQAYVRVGSSSKKMPQEEYQRRLVVYKSPNQDYSATVIQEATLEDLSTDSLSELRKLLNESDRVSIKIDQLNDHQLLTDLNLIQDNRLTLASLILLGKESTLKRYLPYAEIRFGYKVDPSEIRNQDTLILAEGYLSSYKKLFDKINSRNTTVSIPFGMRIIERKTFDEESIREAVNNAVIHRDYSIGASSFIFQYPNSISIISPGGFPEGINVDNIADQSKPRNKLIADVLFKCSFVEQFGNGVNLMIRNQLSLGKALPNYSKTTDTQVILDLSGTIEDIEFAKYVMRVAEEKDKKLNDQELIILNRIKSNKRVLSLEITDNLLELDLIEQISKGKFILSRKYYSDNNKRAEYTIKAGFNKEERKMLIIKHLKNYGKGDMKEFTELFKDLSAQQIYNYLKELRDKDKKIKFIGNPRIPRGENKGYWELV